MKGLEMVWKASTYVHAVVWYIYDAQVSFKQGSQQYPTRYVGIVKVWKPRVDKKCS